MIRNKKNKLYRPQRDRRELKLIAMKNMKDEIVLLWKMTRSRELNQTFPGVTKN